MEADIQREIEAIKIEHAKYGLTLQPSIVVVGTIDAIEKVFIVANNIKLECQSFLRAIDSVFKFYMVMDCHYNAECQQVWEFLQIYLYNIKTKHDKKQKCVLNLIHEFNVLSKS